MPVGIRAGLSARAHRRRRCAAAAPGPAQHRDEQRARDQQRDHLRRLPRVPDRHGAALRRLGRGQRRRETGGTRGTGAAHRPADRARAHRPHRHRHGRGRRPRLGEGDEAGTPPRGKRHLDPRRRHRAWPPHSPGAPPSAAALLPDRHVVQPPGAGRRLLALRRQVRRQQGIGPGIRRRASLTRPRPGVLGRRHFRVPLRQAHISAAGGLRVEVVHPGHTFALRERYGTLRAQSAFLVGRTPCA
ncbi:hypothetical protein SBA4_1540022 [Candidatus Sulfopaludibacter sp. SbA4]|nr:hypothetical protein SBA4_1540022 [Candidatus Sulfopaludibacter sp. SbA4]